MNNNNMYAVVLFIVLVITTTTMSSVLCSSSANINNDDKEILMVVEEQTSSMEQPITGMDQKHPVELGRIGLKGGRSVTLSSLVNGRENSCVPPGDPCGALDWCCEGLYCTNPVYGSCKPIENCRKKGDTCLTVVRFECCYPLKCSDSVYGGKCV
uniref:uncharacterized protein LOC122598374 n=1 Tax=Erigeron canadensis TaxID=72917 RepID=UPI001CB970FB|nr:uncharacterized protein LOC122598374 [Erigeron canadensis]